MPDAAKADLLRALGGLVRGLSTLFWGLPLTWIIYVETAETDRLDFFGPLTFAPAVVLSVVLWHGLNQMRAFQRQERIWQRALSRVEVFAVVDAGLAPFLFWWHRFPYIPLFGGCAALLFLSSLCLLVLINSLLQRLCAMLPDETLRAETKLFTTFNIFLLLTSFIGLAIYWALPRVVILPHFVERWLDAASVPGIWLLLFLILMPLVMTMALMWKIKEVIFASILDAER